MSEKVSPVAAHYREAILLATGLLVISVASVTQLLQAAKSSDTLLVLGCITIQLLGDFPLTISSHAFAVAIPLLALTVLIRTSALLYEYDVKYRREDWTFGIGSFAAGIAIVALFWHFSPLAGVLSLASGVAALVIYHGWKTRMDDVEQDSSPNQPNT